MLAGNTIVKYDDKKGETIKWDFMITASQSAMVKQYR